MKKSRYSEAQIVRILKEVEAGKLVKDACREYGISDATYYNWKAKYGGMEASDIKRLKELEAENQRLKQMFPDKSFSSLLHCWQICCRTLSIGIDVYRGR